MSDTSTRAFRLDRATDRLSPMLVKELRQGIKSRAFGFAFLLLQGLMVFSVLLSASEMGNRRSVTHSFTQAVFWMCVAAPLLLIMPLRALFGLQQEFRGNTMELLFLTRLSAWRIVAGKWVALFSQTLLLASGLLPYLLLRYFFGGVNVASDLQVFVSLLLSSGLLCAAGLCFSAYRNPAVRVLAIIAALLLPSIGSVVVGVASASSSPASAAPPHPALIFALTLAATGLLTGLLLSWATDRIAPPAHSQAAPKRLITLLLVAGCALFAWYTHERGLHYLSLAVLLPVCLEALSEPLRAIPSIYAGRARHGWIGRALNRILSPGWAPSALFTLLLLILWSGLALALRLDREHDLAILLTLPAALLGPLVLLQLFRPDSPRHTLRYIILQLTLFVLGCLFILLHAFRPFPIPLVAWLPTTSFVLAVFRADFTGATLAVAGAADLAIVVLLLFQLRGPSARIRAWEERALRDLAGGEPGTGSSENYETR